MKRLSDDPTLVDADQSGDSSGTTKDFLRQTRSVDLRGRRVTCPALYRLRSCYVPRAAPNGYDRTGQRKAPGVSRPARNQTGNDQTGSSWNSRKAAPGFSLDR